MTKSQTELFSLKRKETDTQQNIGSSKIIHIKVVAPHLNVHHSMTLRLVLAGNWSIIRLHHYMVQVYV
jgi:hypothetical protein